MSYITDEDSAITVNAEESAYTEWEKEKKNAILKMSDERRKQVEWNKLFIKTEPSEVPY